MQSIHFPNLFRDTFKLSLPVYLIFASFCLISSVRSQDNIAEFTEDPTVPSTNYTTSCEAFFDAYVEAAGNFTHCELLHAKPFRMCTKCYEPYAVMRSLYEDLTNDPKLHECMEKYLKADRVQIIPLMQQNANEVWKNSACRGCVDDLHVSPKTKEVKFIVPDSVKKFMDLYSNISHCLQQSTMSDFDYLRDENNDNASVLCTLCEDNYKCLNSHYKSMANDASGDVCMDVVDMMNYTRVAWSEKLNCSHRTADALFVILIAVVVGISPCFFYSLLRYFSEEKSKKVFKQKRLGTSYESTAAGNSISLFSSSSGAGGSGTVNRGHTPLPRIA